MKRPDAIEYPAVYGKYVDPVEEFRLVRAAFRRIFDFTTEQQHGLVGNGVNGGITGRALASIAIGHALHYQQVVAERYL